MRELTTAVLATLALTLSACTKDDPPPPDPTSAATTPANPDATLPPMPAVAKEFTPNGAATFVRYYVSLLDYASKTGDVEQLVRVSGPDCGGCSDYIQLFSDTYKSGGYIVGRNWKRGGTDLDFVSQRGSESFATTTITISAGINRLSADKDEKRVTASRDRVTFGVAFDDDWTVTQFGLGELG